MSIFKDEFKKIKLQLAPMQSQKERLAISEIVGVSESSIAKLRDGRMQNPTLTVLDSLHDHFFRTEKQNKEDEASNKNVEAA